MERMNSATPPSPDRVQGDSDSRASPGGRCPSLSVVVCTRDRPQALAACVRSVAGQTLRPAELIVVDDGELSEQDLGTLRSICEPAGIPLVYLRKAEPSLPKSRNLAVRHTRGEIVQFLDDDVTLEPEFCREILDLYAADADGTLLGTEGALIEPGPHSFRARIFDWVYQLAGWWALRPRTCDRPPSPPPLRNPRRATPAWNIVGATMAFRRSALLTRPFDEVLSGYALGEDRDMAYRISRHGWIARSHTARAIHHHEPAGRPHPFTFGRMVVRNYVRIMMRNGLTGVGDRLVIAYSITVVALSLLPFSLVSPRRYLPEFLGMVAGGCQLICGAAKRHTCS